MLDELQDRMVVYQSPKNKKVTILTRKIKKISEGGDGLNISFNGESERFYTNQEVCVLENPEILDPALCKIKHQSKTFFDLVKILRFKNSDGFVGYRIYFKNGEIVEYLDSDITIDESPLKNEKYKHCFDYLKEISTLSDVNRKKKREKEGNDESDDSEIEEVSDGHVLARYYEKLGLFIHPDSILCTYLAPESYKNSNNKETVPIFPFSCNRSQMKAVRNALTNKLSIIEGPPGTGKTQTILNIIANLVLQGKSVIIVSNSNSATANVFEKLEKYQLSFIAAKLGKKDNKDEFIASQTGKYPDWSDFKTSAVMDSDSMSALQEELVEAYAREEDIAVLRDKISQFEVEHTHYQKTLSPDIVFPEERKTMGSKLLGSLICKMEHRSLKKDQLSFGTRLYLRLLKQVGPWSYWSKPITTLLPIIKELWYCRKIAEMKDAVAADVEELKISNSESKTAELVEKSMAILKYSLYQKYGKDRRTIFSSEALWRNSKQFINEYPVILSTTFSATKCLSSDTVYDYVIMDEASQVDIATGALALSVARNAVIVGDSKQLSNIVDADIEPNSKVIFKKYEIDKYYDFARYSFLDSIKGLFPSCPNVLLREHYRCHPKIIGFCNKEFYDGKLLAMTEDHGEDDVLTVLRTSPGDHFRKDYLNQREVDCIEKEVIPKIESSMSDVGIIAPYNHQVDALAEVAPNSDVSTVYKFQGREKKIIILSTTDSKASNMSKNPNHLNVAVSRAMERFVLVTHNDPKILGPYIKDLVDYIDYNTFTVTESKLRSVFDLMYDELKEERERYLKNSKDDRELSEILVHKLLSDILVENGFCNLDILPQQSLMSLIDDMSLMTDDEKDYATKDGTHIDLLIYNKLSKQPVLAIEVDGYSYHKKNSRQGKRDSMKNSIMEKYGLPLLRLKTNGCEEREKIETKLNEIINQYS